MHSHIVKKNCIHIKASGYHKSLLASVCYVVTWLMAQRVASLIMWLHRGIKWIRQYFYLLLSPKRQHHICLPVIQGQYTVLSGLRWSLEMTQWCKSQCLCSSWLCSQIPDTDHSMLNPGASWLATKLQCCMLLTINGGPFFKNDIVAVFYDME